MSVSIPDIEVQLAEMVTPDDLDRYLDRQAERKYDGVRCWTHDGRLYTRNGNDITERFPEIDAPDAHVFDGEIIVADGNELADFETVLRRTQTEDRFKVELLADRYPARLVVFDALFVNGGDVRDEPLAERQALIEPSLPAGAGLLEVTTYDDPLDLWDQATDKGWEGIMLKDPDASYSGGRGRDWLKVKDWKVSTFPYVDHEHTDDGGFVVYVGVGTEEPQKVAVQDPDDRVAVEAGDIDAVRVQYLERSRNGRLRKPSFKGVA